MSFTDINHFSISLSFSYWNITDAYSVYDQPTVPTHIVANANNCSLFKADNEIACGKLQTTSCTPACRIGWAL